MYRMFTILTALILAGSTCQAHPNHIGVTEVEWNPTSGRFEVAMKLRVTDLEDAISVINKQQWRLESAADRDQQLQAYLQKHFSITFKDHGKCRLHWVGTELLLHEVWIYFEAESLPGGSRPDDSKSNSEEEVSSFDELLQSGSSGSDSASAVVIRNTALMEIQPEQTHAVAMLKKGRRSTFQLNRKHSVAEFKGLSAVAVRR